MRKLLLLFALLPCTAFPQIQVQTFENDPIGVKQYVLKNGLHVYLTEKHDVPRVFGAVVVKTGGKNDPHDNTGMAHYLEHMLFKGTTELGTSNYEKEKIHLDEISRLYDQLATTKNEAERKNIQKKINEESVKAAAYAIPNEMDRMLSEIGGEDVNAFTTDEITAYFNSFPSNQIRRWLDVYDHRFEKPVFRLFQSELETVYEEKNRGMDNPIEFVLEKYMEKFYKVHPYGQQTVIGKTEHLKNPSLRVMYEYYNTYYVANNMALILSGDFNSDEVIRMIEEKFSDWRSAPVPVFPTYEEKDFNGRELLKLRATPVKAGAIGFRVPAKNHADEACVEVLLNLLSNGQAGVLDRLSTEGKILQSGAFPMINTDYGAAIFYFIPKLIGQPLKKAEALIREEIEKIKAGDFEDNQLEAVKTSLIKSFQRNWEKNDDRALAIGTAFFTGISWGEYLQYEKKIRSVSRADLVRVANRYLNGNSLVLHSKMGKIKKEKLEKPGFQPVIPKTETHSAYYENWKKIPEDPARPKFVNFETDLQTVAFGKHVTFKQAPNPYNSIFSLKLRFGTGKYYDPFLKLVPNYLAYADSEKYSADEFKNALFVLGCSSGQYVTDDEFVITLEGLEENLPAALQICSMYYTGIRSDDAKMKKLIADLDAELKISTRQPSYMAGVLNSYVLLGKNSAFLREISLGEARKIKADALTASLKKALQHELTIHYIGNLKKEEMQTAFATSFLCESRIAKKEKVYLERTLNSENTIYVLDDKKARQTQLHFFIEGKKHESSMTPAIAAFNKYFGGDMSSLVFQEIREFRSLAYSTYAQYAMPSKPGEKCFFAGFIGCQNDKTLDAIKAMLELIHNMPQKPERWPAVQSSLIQAAQSERPGFRSIIETVENWQYKGYHQDPNPKLIEAFQQMNFDTLSSFWEKEIRKHPTTITLVGNSAAFDMKSLEQFGKVVLVKKDEIMKK